MTKILCLFGFHDFEYEESVLKFVGIAELIVKPELIALVFLIIYVGVMMNGF